MIPTEEAPNYPCIQNLAILNNIVKNKKIRQEIHERKKAMNQYPFIKNLKDYVDSPAFKECLIVIDNYQRTDLASFSLPILLRRPVSVHFFEDKRQAVRSRRDLVGPGNIIVENITAIFVVAMTSLDFPTLQLSIYRVQFQNFLRELKHGTLETEIFVLGLGYVSLHHTQKHGIVKLK